MRLKIDKESDSLFLRLDETEIVGSEQVAPGVILDYDENDRVIGIEIMQLNNGCVSNKL